jgi:hypothetical protein
MPAVSKKQRRFMAIELENLKAGKAMKTKMNENQLEDFANTSEAKLPDKRPNKRITRHIKRARIPKRIFRHKG